MIIFTQMAKEQQGEELSIRSRVFLPDAAAVEDPAVSGDCSSAICSSSRPARHMRH